MPSMMISGFTLLSVLAAVGHAAPPTVPAPTATEAMQTFLSVSNLNAAQASQVSARFLADHNAYYSTLSNDPGFKTAYSVAATAMPASVMSAAAVDPELFLASLARARRDDLPAWYTSMPIPVQDFWRSVGSHDIQMYTSEVNAARPLASTVLASLSSQSSSLSSRASSLSSQTESLASSLASASASVVLKGTAPASPATSGHMLVVAAGVAIAAGLVSMAML